MKQEFYAPPQIGFTVFVMAFFWGDSPDFDNSERKLFFFGVSAEASACRRRSVFLKSGSLLF